MYIQSLEIENLRTFERAQIRFNVPSDEPAAKSPVLPNVNLLLGDNGSGKTTVLRAVALAALGPLLTSGSGFVPYSLVRRGSRIAPLPARIGAELLLHPQDQHPGTRKVETIIDPTGGWVDRFQSIPPPSWAEPMWQEKSAAFLMVGYGASRRVDPNANFSEELRSKTRALRYSRVAGLFEEAVTMVPLSAWLPAFRTQNRGRHSQVIALLNRLLAPHAQLLPNPVDNQYLFRIGGADLPFQALSDGFRAYIGWIADLLYHVCMGTPSGRKLIENRGVVLVDEVDLHLHPEWQQTVIPTLARALPNLQFVLTSHSPLLVGTIHGSNVFVLESEGTGEVRRNRIRPSDEEVYGLSADQILTSGHFGLASARDPSFTQSLATEAQAARTEGPEAALRFMRLMALGAGAGEDLPPVPAAPAATEPRRRSATAGAAAGKKAKGRSSRSVRKAPAKTR